MWPLGIDQRSSGVDPRCGSTRRLERLTRVASLGLALAVVGSAVGPAYAESLPASHLIAATNPNVKVPVIEASQPQRPPQAKPVTPPTGVRVANNNVGGEITNVVGPVSNKTTQPSSGFRAISNNLNVRTQLLNEIDTTKAYAAATLKITQVQPTPAIEGQPLQVSFNLTNNSNLYTLSGNVIESGNGQDLFGGGQGINHLAPGVTISGVVSDAAPRATKGFPITLTLQGHFDDGTPAPPQVGGVTCGDCGGTSTTTTASTQVDVAAVYYFELNNFAVDNTRARHLDTDYAALVAEQEPSALILDQTWGPQDVNNGSYSLPPLVVGPYYSVPDDTNALVATYSIVNSGHTSGEDILNAMIQAGIQGAGAAIGTFGQGSSQTNNSFAGAAGGNILGTFLNLFFANRDGVVVNDQIGPYSGGTLAAMTASGSRSEFHYYAGTDSANGCGSNSQYWATWTLTRDNL